MAKPWTNIDLADVVKFAANGWDNRQIANYFDRTEGAIKAILAKLNKPKVVLATKKKAKPVILADERYPAWMYHTAPAPAPKPAAPNKGTHWTVGEVNTLKALFNAGVAIDVVASTLGRTAGGVAGKLKAEGLLTFEKDETTGVMTFYKWTPYYVVPKGK